MMIKARHKKWAHKVFNRYLAYLLKKDFSEFHIKTSLNDFNGSILVLGNHFSWWDGFIVYRLNTLLLHKKFHLMMLEKELSPRPFFSYLGAFSIQQNNRSIIQSLDYTIDLLADPNNMVVIFPQGKIQSMHVNHIEWAKGIGRIINEKEIKFRILFSASFIDYMANRKPSLTTYITEYKLKEGSGLNEVQDAYNHFYKDAKAQQSNLSV